MGVLGGKAENLQGPHGGWTDRGLWGRACTSASVTGQEGQACLCLHLGCLVSSRRAGLPEALAQLGGGGGPEP